MPVYEYFCTKCGEAFTTVMHVTEHEETIPECPKCGRKDDIQKRMSSFTAVTSRKSAGF
jgi:putative FmdB family regulatory protein